MAAPGGGRDTARRRDGVAGALVGRAAAVVGLTAGRVGDVGGQPGGGAVAAAATAPVVVPDRWVHHTHACKGGVDSQHQQPTHTQKMGVLALGEGEIEYELRSMGWVLYVCMHVHVMYM